MSDVCPISDSAYDIYAMRYDADGNPLGTEFRVNTYTTGAQRDAAVAVDGSGNSVITWQSQNQVGSSSAYDADGNFTIVWQSDSVVGGAEHCPNAIFAQRYLADGTAWGGELPVSGSGDYDQTLAAAAIDGSGHLIVAWQAIRNDGTSTDIHALRTAPIATAEEYVGAVNQALSIDAASGVLANDYFAGASVAVALVDGPTKGAVSLAADGSFIYTPNANVAGTDTFSYRVWVGDEYSTVVKVTIVIVDADALATIAARLYSQAMGGASSSPAKVSALLAKMTVATVPEPATIVTLTSGAVCLLAGAWWYRRRAKRRSAAMEEEPEPLFED